MNKKILRETFDPNLNETFRIRELKNGHSVFTDKERIDKFKG